MRKSGTAAFRLALCLLSRVLNLGKGARLLFTLTKGFLPVNRLPSKPPPPAYRSHWASLWQSPRARAPEA